jgi:hypothetical protein
MGKVINEVHSVGAGHPLVFISLTYGLSEVRLGLLIKLTVSIRKTTLIVVPPLVSKSPANRAVFLAVFRVNGPSTLDSTLAE